jgi:arginine exporter protein ArgO
MEEKIMISYIVVFIAGAVAASVVWFFVWKNNKEKFEAALLEAEKRSISLLAAAQKG